MLKRVKIKIKPRLWLAGTHMHVRFCTCIKKDAAKTAHLLTAVSLVL